MCIGEGGHWLRPSLQRGWIAWPCAPLSSAPRHCTRLALPSVSIGTAFNPGLQPPEATHAHLLTSLPVTKPQDEVGSGPPLPLPLEVMLQGKVEGVVDW